jgi:hypothetical protein
MISSDGRCSRRASSPDVALFGFALTEAEVRGDVGAGDPGMVLRVRGAARRSALRTRYGRERRAERPGTIWRGSTWSATPAPVTSIDYIDLERAEPATGPLETATGPIWHATAPAPGGRVARGADHAVITLQRPVRVALYGADLLP